MIGAAARNANPERRDLGAFDVDARSAGTALSQDAFLALAEAAETMVQLTIADHAEWVQTTRQLSSARPNQSCVATLPAMICV